MVLRFCGRVGRRPSYCLKPNPYTVGLFNLNLSVLKHAQIKFRKKEGKCLYFKKNRLLLQPDWKQPSAISLKAWKRDNKENRITELKKENKNFKKGTNRGYQLEGHKGIKRNNVLWRYWSNNNLARRKKTLWSIAISRESGALYNKRRAKN